MKKFFRAQKQAGT